jgi:hypothetical protein
MYATALSADRTAPSALACGPPRSTQAPLWPPWEPGRLWRRACPHGALGRGATFPRSEPVVGVVMPAVSSVVGRRGAADAAATLPPAFAPFAGAGAAGAARAPAATVPVAAGPASSTVMFTLSRAILKCLA